jgi:hypothetical protein
MSTPRPVAARLLAMAATLIALSSAGGPKAGPPAALAGSGPTVNVPASNLAVTLDGVCSGPEYSDANQVSVSVEAAPYTFTVYLKHTWDYLYVCFDNPPLPNGGASFVSVYIDRDNDGGTRDSQDFRVNMPWDPNGSPSAAYWGGSTYNGADPGGWQAVKHQIIQPETNLWEVEFRLSRQVVGGWQRSAGLALFYQWYRFTGDDYAWPADNVWSNPSLWGNANFLTATFNIGPSASGPIVNGICNEYSGANTLSFVSAGRTVTAYLKHTDTDLYICMQNLAVPSVSQRNGPNAAVYLNRAGTGGDTPGPDDIRYSIAFSGTVRVNLGDGADYAGPDPGGYQIARMITRDPSLNPVSWDVEFRISAGVVGGLLGRDLDLALVQQWVSFSGNDYGWPMGYHWNVPNTWGVANLTGSGSPASTDLDIANVEVVQSIQDVNNSVVLVAGKRTFVRVHLASNATVNQVRARLSGLRNNQPLGFALLPLNPGGVINVVPQPDRANLNDSFYFELPQTWISGGPITLVAEANPFADIAESNYNNNTFSLTPNFIATHPLRLLLINYQYQWGVGQTLVSASDLDMDLLESQLRRMYPISQLLVRRRVFLDEDISTVPSSGYVNTQLAALRDVYEGNWNGWKFYGMVSDLRGFMRGSSSDIPGNSAAGPSGVPAGDWAWDTDGSYADWYGAHELGHTLGRYHAEFCNAVDGVPYPYPDATIGGPAGTPTRFYGLDHGDAANNLPLQVIPPTWTDIMAYCANEWISDFTYEGIHSYIQASLPAQATADDVSGELAASPAVAGDFLAVYGTLDTIAQTAALPFVARQAQVSVIPPLVPGPYHIRLLDVGDSLLADYAFTPHPNTDDEGAMATIAQIVNWVGGTRRIAIYSDPAGGEVASVTVSANPPSVSGVTHTGGASLPASGALNLNWTAADADGDALTFTVLYSNDNRATWRALASGIHSPSLALDAANLEGTGGIARGWFRVVADDGVLTGVADDGPLTVAGKAPEVTLLSPANGSAYLYGQPVALEGIGQDLEDGTLADARLTWSSNLDGFLGTGHLLHVELLSGGTHVLTLTATDSNNQSASATVSITVSGAMAAAGPTLDVGQSSMLFIGQPGGPAPASQALSVRNLGSGSLAWSVSSDSAWLLPGAPAGGTPTDLSVSVNTSALLGGTARLGHLTFTAPGAAGSPLVVDVVVQMLGAPSDRFYIPLVQR